MKEFSYLKMNDDMLYATVKKYALIRERLLLMDERMRD